MAKNKLERKAKQLHNRAGLLLQDTRLISQLKQFGRVVITGSYAMDLMTNPDIDIYVINHKMTKKIAVAVLNKLIYSNYFRGHLFYDFTVHRHIGFPKGWYVGLKKRVRGEKWKMDIWLLKKDVRPRLNTQQMTRTQRRKILALKTRRDGLGIDVPAWYIYQAVLKRDPAAMKITKAAGLLTS